jgi:hypothetical protein
LSFGSGAQLKNSVRISTALKWFYCLVHFTIAWNSEYYSDDYNSLHSGRTVY